MADVLLTHSYMLSLDPKEHRAMMPYPPLGTLYAASMLREAGFSVALYDVMLESDPSCLTQHLETHRPSIVVIYDDDFNYLTKMCLTRMRDVAFELSRIARRAGCPVIVHGSDSVDHLDAYFSHGADYVLCGEAEVTLLELVNVLIRDPSSGPENIAGLAFISDGVIRRTDSRPVSKDLDALPFPAWDLVEADRYRRAWKKAHGYFSINMVTTRGCPFHCNWCAKPIYGQVYNSRSPRNVVKEMKYLRSTLNPDHIWFCDDIFGLKPGWIQMFSEEVRRQNAIIPFKCLARVDLLLKDNVIEHLAKAGCQTVWVGAESGSQNILDAMDKGTTVEHIYEATRLLKAAGIRVGFFIQYGYPGETLEDIQLTLNMIRDCLPDDIGVSVSYPLPGTRFYDRVQSQMGKKMNWVDSQDLAMMFAGNYHPDFYRALHTVTHKRFRIWQGKEYLRRGLKRPASISRSVTRRLLSGLYHRMTLASAEQKLQTLALNPIGAE